MSGVAPSMDVSAVMPAYNEQANLEQSVDRTAGALAVHARSFEIIVVDDGSRDGTASVLERLKTLHPNLRVVRHPVNRGYGAAVRSGFDAARLPWVFLMDADNQFDPAEIGLLLARAAEADIVAGYRRHRRDPLPRRLNAWAFFTLVRLLFGRLARDVNCAFKLIRRDLLTRMALHSEGALIVTAGRGGRCGAAWRRPAAATGSSAMPTSACRSMTWESCGGRCETERGPGSAQVGSAIRRWNCISPGTARRWARSSTGWCASWCLAVSPIRSAASRRSARRWPTESFPHCRPAASVLTSRCCIGRSWPATGWWRFPPAGSTRRRAGCIRSGTRRRCSSSCWRSRTGW